MLHVAAHGCRFTSCKQPFNLFGSIPRTLVRKLAIASSLKSGVNTPQLAAGCFIAGITSYATPLLRLMNLDNVPVAAQMICSAAASFNQYICLWTPVVSSAILLSADS